MAKSQCADRITFHLTVHPVDLLDAMDVVGRCSTGNGRHHAQSVLGC